MYSTAAGNILIRPILDLIISISISINVIVPLALSVFS